MTDAWGRTLREEWEIVGDPGPGFPRPYRWVFGDGWHTPQPDLGSTPGEQARTLFEQLTTSRDGRPPALTDAHLRMRTVIETRWEEVIP